jgi:hypothetical protein
MLRSSRTAPVLGGLALLVAVAAVVFAATGVSVGGGALRTSTTPQAGKVLRLGPDKRFPAGAIPTVGHARRTSRVGTLTEDRARIACAPGTADLRTWCLDKDVRGVADYGGASHRCVALGGYLPTAAQLIGAAPRVRLSGRLDDNPSLAAVDPNHRRDLREMSSTLLTTTTGSAAAGSTTNPVPATLQFVGVYDNRDRGGFAGGISVTTAERFRCGFIKRQTGPAAKVRVAILAVAARRGRRIDVTTRLPTNGQATVLATVRAKGRTLTVARGWLRVTAAGDVRIGLRPTAAGRKRLRPGQTAAVSLRVSFRRPTGTVLVATTSQRLRIPRS